MEMSSLECLTSETKPKRRKSAYRSVHSCNQCAYMTKSLFFMKLHVKHHEQKAREFSCSNSIDAYLCRRWNCLFMTHCITAFNAHLKRKHNTKVRKQPRPGPKSRIMYRCKKCSFPTFSKLVLLKHVRRTCKNREIKIKRDLNKANELTTFFKCDQCSLQTRFRQNLMRHKKSQHEAAEKIKWFKCDQCDFQAKNRDNIKSHQISKHLNYGDIKWHKCDYCPYKGKKRSALTVHLMSKHTESQDIMWYKCANCEFRSKKKFNLQVHLRSMHRRGDV